MRWFVITAWVALAVQQPVFRSRVDLLRLDVTVVDADGRPVRDLRPEDFVVTLDGRPRRVAVARFYGPADAASPPADRPVSMATNTSIAPGRVVVFVADLESLVPGYEKPILDTAARLLDGLGPSDAVGLLPIPGKGIELTRDHTKIRDALRSLRGWASPPPRHTLSVREAEGFVNKDRRIISTVYERECRPSDSSCPSEVAAQVMPMLIESDRRVQSMVGSLTALYENLARIKAPTSVIVLSAGLQRRQGAVSWFADLERRAAAAGVSTTVVQIEQAENDPSRRTSGGIPRSDLFDGLSYLAGVTDASMYYGIATAAGAFERIRNEIVHVYELGVEPAPEDADGRKRRVNVDVKRPGVSVRSRREVVLSSPTSAEVNPVELLSQPVDLLDVPLAVGTYMTRGDDASTLKVLLLIELLNRREHGSSAASYALAVTKDGRNVFETADRIAADSGRVAFAAQLAPGQYRLRVAVVDEQGLPGTLDIPIVVGLRQVGALQFSDLIVGDGRTGSFLPASRVNPATPVEALLELYSADPTQLDDLQVSFEVRRPGTSAAATTVRGEVRRTALDRRRVSSAVVPASALTNGSYLIAAIIRRGDNVVGQVSRPLVVE